MCGTQRKSFQETHDPNIYLLVKLFRNNGISTPKREARRNDFPGPIIQADSSYSLYIDHTTGVDESIMRSLRDLEYENIVREDRLLGHRLLQLC